jgi:hypothetical protein
MRCSDGTFRLLVLPFLLLSGLVAATAAPVQLRFVCADGFRAEVPFLVRVEALDARGVPDRSVWNDQVTLSVDRPGVTLSTNVVALRNGMGSALVRVTGAEDFNLTATFGELTASRLVVDRSGEAVTSVGGTLSGTESDWSGVVLVTSDVTVPPGHTLTIQPGTLVMFEGVASGTTANDLVVRGSVQSLGTESQPVTFTCSQADLRWGQLRHTNAQPSVYRHTIVTRGGRGRGEGHTGTVPVVRPYNSRMTFENCSLTDFADANGTPGKIGQASGSDLTFVSCLFQRARMGPEISGTALACTNTWILDMAGPDDADGIYLHDQAAGQSVTLSGCVLAAGGDDGIDTLGSVITVENCIVRDWNSVLEDAKGISALNGAVHVRNSLIVDCTVGIAAKSGGGTPSTTPVLVTVNNSTLSGNTTNLYANRKSSAVGPHVLITATNSIIVNGKPAYSDFEPETSDSTNFVIRYCNLAEPYAGEGNTSADPLFVGLAAHDFRLAPHSPSIDSGNPASPLDPDGSAADQGAFAFLAPAPALGTPRRRAGETVEISLVAYPQRNYVIESSQDLATWGFLKTVFQTVETNLVADPSAAGEPRRFYRARLAP